MFVRYFFNGTLFIVPLVATLYFIFEAFTWLDSRFNLPYPGVGFVLIITGITLFGYFTSHFAFRTFSNWFEQVIGRIPLVKLVYSSIKDLMAAFVGEKKKFDRPVLVTLNRDTRLQRIGFITQDDLSHLGLPDRVVVYFPQSYAMAGDHFLVPKECIEPLQVSGSQAMKFIISGGVSGL
ncbi:MAG: membrane protein [Cyclobacteriaceae bacterium]|nr:MAG: membrane protein [Cyclobacteriaceae bacterium]